ncbi:MAG TPA: magnesium chelatase domain-containing protein, partial [Leptospiraceae bacterium]|nr:magnesium chelatase domain-containing protein [Leptospiraceae bacterium]
DTVLYFESDKLNYYRLLRGIKNRFGAVGDIAVFEMRSNGLTEIIDKHNLFISPDHENRTGSILSVVMEGSRSLSVEVQALVSRSSYSQARRTAEGLDNKRLVLLAAVLEKFMGIKTIECDIFCNLAGGLNIDEPALDLAICASIVSSYIEKPAKKNYAVIGEVGLSGEVRTVSHIHTRLKDLTSIGITNIILPKGNLTEVKDKNHKIELIPIESIRELEKLF